MSNFVFVLDTQYRVLSPCKPSVADRLCEAGKAAVYRRYPYTIILKKEVADATPEPIELKIDPGSRVTGLALKQGNKIIWGAELTHRGQTIKASLDSRRALRRSRRNRHTRYRPARFNNRARPKGWLAPSLLHRVLTIETWVNRICKFAPIGSMAMELVRFDTQELQTPEITGEQYQQGTLYQYEVREYLLEKWNRTCAYCGANNTPLEVEHIVPKSRGGTNRVSNLTLACIPCNQAKGTQDIRDFLAQKPELAKRILTGAKAPLKDAAVMNSTRWKLFETLKETGLPISVGSGGQTKFHRTRLELPKAHWLDAACVGNVDTLDVQTHKPLKIKATGLGTRQMCGTDKYGFPIRHRSKQQVHFGFQTGDIVQAIVTQGKKIGSYVGRVLCRKSGSFDIATPSGRVSGISYKYCSVIHKKDGYSYVF
jgi:5-methylcytosine-specific restriction endonuclease McrA